MKQIILFFIILYLGSDGLPQESIPTEDVTFDEINAVASRMYCPICENEPLDTCRATTCIEWREEIQQQLADGRTSDEIVDYFVRQYGNRVVGIPKDNSLRAYILITPLIVILFALWMSRKTILQWRTGPKGQIEITETNTVDEHSNYRDRLEQDLKR